MMKFVKLAARCFVMVLFALSLIGGLWYKKYTEEQKYVTYDSMRAQALDIYENLSQHAGVPVPPLTVLDSDILNAWYDGDSVTITTYLIKKLNNTDGIAFVLAHEMGHAILHHEQELVSSQIDKENAADEIGTFLMLRSGYDICEGREFFSVIAHMGNGDFADPTFTDHPSDIFRFNTLSMPWCPVQRF